VSASRERPIFGEYFCVWAVYSSALDAYSKVLKRALNERPESFRGKILDFGGGNRELIKLIARGFPKAQIVCYEPAPKLSEEAKHTLSGLDNVTLVNSL
jgi:hypothetical protein